MAETAKSGNLVLTRKGAPHGEEEGERILIGPDTWVTIGKIRGDKCKVIINAPRDVRVIREECLPEDQRYAAVAGLPEAVPDEALRRTA